ncbi:DUF2071 domain-containing protein [Hyunsoonleella flava]|uniref:DUF2071 domain-containing protein n=1 Tax=Hyunsoonleella flava TaxID=2527939 RepID=A0A4Q9FDS6_9FLAO|nr:DUF2071 domain-containing protein [Hyunsoonleella flava]TBN01334.1 DUF2071 domain-containing protein [Hyunsoonleella flava]
MTFLRAYWKNLILINYEIPQELLLPYLPKGTVLDFYNGKCYVSLVGFMFQDTKVLGLKLFNHVNFEEVNLRFYVKRNNKRGVVFIKEIVPKPLITFIANSIYKEHYQTLEMQHRWTYGEKTKNFEYQWLINDTWQSIAVQTEKNLSPIPKNSIEEFITEHYFGYTKHGNTTFEYEVEHLRWQQLKVKRFEIHMDFENTYESDFKFLNQSKPESVILATGSKICVKSKKKI